MAKIKSDAHLYLSPTGSIPPTPVPITGATNADPMVVTLDGAVPAGTAVGDMLVLDGTGNAALDGKAFRITAVDITDPDAPVVTVDYDASALAAPLAAGTAQVFTKAAAGALLEVCLVNITVAGVAPDSIEMDDMCGTSTVLGSPKPPTFTFSGFVDKDSPGFKNLVQASLESPKTERYMLIDYTVGGGYIFGPVEIGEITITAQTSQGLQFSGSGVFTEMPTYSWAL
jgi:hypothetical protein